MKKDIRFVICLVVIMLLALLCIYSLLADKERDKDTHPDYPEVSITPTQRMIIVTNGEKDVVLGTINFYTVRLSTRNIESVEVAVGQGAEISPELISGYVTDALEDEEIDLDILGIEIKNDICILNFGKSIKDLAEKEADIEKLILDAYSMSIVDNCAGLNGVTFRIEGEPYITRNIKLSDNEVYLKN